MTVRTAIAVALWGWAVIGVCLYIISQIEPVPPLAPASDSLTVDSDANFAAQPSLPPDGWAAPTNNTKGNTP